MLKLIADNPFGSITPPETALSKSGNAGAAIGNLVQLVIYILIAGAGIYALVNFVLAGYAFMSAGDDPKKITGAWAKIWQTALGLAVAAGALVLAALFGRLIFGSGYNILKPVIPSLN